MTDEFTSDEDALELLKTYGHEEDRNGVIKGDWRAFDARCRRAVQYLCDEWDFVFEDTAQADDGKDALIRELVAALKLAIVLKSDKARADTISDAIAIVEAAGYGP